MAVKAKSGISGTRTERPAPKAKCTRQGQGKNSRPSHGRKLSRGQG